LERQRLIQLQETLLDEQDYTADRIADLQAKIAELEGGPPSEDIDQRILNLRGDLLHYQSLRVDLFGSLAQTQAALASVEETSNVLVDTAVVVDPASVPMASQPREFVRTILLALVAALGLGVGLAYLLEYVDYTIKTPEELDADYGMSTLGVIGVVKGASRGQAAQEALVTLTHPQSPAAEAFRALRTNLRFTNPDHPLRSLLVTSAGPAEGKTLISANLAVILAQGGQRVILVDADLRRPRQHRVFDVAREPGLTNLVVDRKDGIEALLQPTAVENLRVLASGRLPRNPAELLISDRAAEVVEQLGEHADIVVYDSPPAGTVTDAAVLGSRVDAVVHVVKAGGPRRDVVLRVKETLQKVGARVLGPILNQVSASDLGYYSHYYDAYYVDGDDTETRPGRRGLLRRRKSEAEDGKE
jgi:capsular exopolysaccharide synthesis family protein